MLPPSKTPFPAAPGMPPVLELAPPRPIGTLPPVDEVVPPLPVEVLPPKATRAPPVDEALPEESSSPPELLSPQPATRFALANSMARTTGSCLNMAITFQRRGVTFPTGPRSALDAPSYSRNPKSGAGSFDTCREFAGNSRFEHATKRPEPLRHNWPFPSKNR